MLVNIVLEALSKDTYHKKMLRILWILLLANFIFNQHAYAQTVEFKNNEKHFLFKADKKRVQFTNSLFKHSVPVQKCNQKITRKLVASLGEAEKKLKLNKVVFGKNQWVRFNSKKYPLLMMSHTTKKMERLPAQFVAYSLESQKVCKNKRRKISSDELTTADTVPLSSVATETSASRCVNDLCPSSVHETYKAKASLLYAAELVREDYSSEIDPYVQRVIDSENTFNTTLDEQARQWLERDGLIRDPYEKKLFTAFLAQQITDKLVLERNAQGSIVVNRAATLAASPEIKAQDLDNIVLTIEGLYNGLFSNSNMAVLYSWEDLILTYNSQELTTKLEEMISAVEMYKNETAEFTDILRLEKISVIGEIFDTSRFRSQLASGPSRSLLNELQKAFQFSFLFHVANSSQIAVSPLPLNVRQQVLRFLPQNLESFDRDAASSGSRNECLMTFAAGRLFLPTRNELASAEPRLAELKRKFLNKLDTIYSVTTAQAIRSDAAQWTFQLPLAKEIFPETLRNALDEKQKKMSTRLASLRASSSQNMDFLYALNTLYREHGVESEYLAEDLCTGLAPEQIDDAASTISTKVRVSPLSVRAGAAADGIVLHELAHKLFRNLRTNHRMSAHSQGIHQNIKTCLTSLHLPATQTYLDEDYADFISALIGGSQNSNLACFLVRQDDPTYILQNADPADSHSSGFFRLLHYELLQKNQLPESCLQAARIEQANGTIKNCK